LIHTINTAEVPKKAKADRFNFPEEQKEKSSLKRILKDFVPFFDQRPLHEKLCLKMLEDLFIRRDNQRLICEEDSSFLKYVRRALVCSQPSGTCDTMSAYHDTGSNKSHPVRRPDDARSAYDESVKFTKELCEAIESNKNINDICEIIDKTILLAHVDYGSNTQEIKLRNMFFYQIEKLIQKCSSKVAKKYTHITFHNPEKRRSANPERMRNLQRLKGREKYASLLQNLTPQQRCTLLQGYRRWLIIELS